MSLFKKIKSKITLFMGLIISQMLITKNVFAQASGGAFEPPAASDMSRQFINQIFGGLLDGGADAFGDSITTFNSAILIVGGILAAYTILSGTLNTAHDGEMLGKKFSSIWIPIRYALGTALVLPIISGYCLMQVMVMWIVMQGASLGNIAWVSYVGSAPQLSMKVSPTTKANIEYFVQNVYLANVCTEAKNYASELAPQPLKLLDRTYGFRDNGAISPSANPSWNFGATNTFLGRESAICGYIEKPKAPIEKNSTFTNPNLSSMANLEQSYKLSTSKIEPIYQAHMDKILSTMQKTQELAKKAVRNPNSVNYSELQAIADEYYNEIMSKANGINTTDLKSQMRQIAQNQGWFLAGTWITQIIQEQNKINSFVNFVPSSNIKMTVLQSAIADDDKIYSQNGYQLLKFRTDVNSFLNNNKENNDSSRQGESTEVGGGGKVASYLSKFVAGVDLEDIKNDNRHPLIAMSQIGDSILSSIMAAIQWIAGLAVGGGTIASVIGLGAAAITFAITFFGIFAIPLFGFIGIAGMLAYILPNLPFLLWVGIIIGWTVMVVEAIIAAPLWAVMHLHPNGDDLTGRGGNGYMLVLGLLLRPILIVFGLISAIILSGLFGQLINRVFFDIFSNNVASSTLGFFAMLFGLGVYTALMFTVIKQTFNLMYIIPDQLLRWIGGGQEQLGQYAGGLSAEGMAKGSAIAGAAAGFVTRDLAQQGQQAAGNLGQIGAQLKGNQLKKEDSGRRIIENQQAQEKEQFKADLASPGRAEVRAAIGQKNGNDISNANRQQRQFDSNYNTLNKIDPNLAVDYANQLSESMNEGNSFSDSSMKAMSDAIESKYGKEGVKAIQAATKGGMANESGSFSSIVRNLDKAQKSYEKSGLSPDDAKKQLGNVINNALSTGTTGSSFVRNLQNAHETNKETLGIIKTSNDEISSVSDVDRAEVTSKNDTTDVKFNNVEPKITKGGESK